MLVAAPSWIGANDAQVGVLEHSGELMFMVINANSPAANGGNLNVNAATQPRSTARPKSAPEPEAEVVISPRNSIQPSEIDSEKDALETTEFARKQILGNPNSVVGVQANSRPEVVFELLQGLLV